MFVSFIITHYKKPKLLKTCIESIKTHIRGVDYEIIAADSDTQEETRKLLRTYFPDVILSESKKNLGYPKIVNKALARARGSCIAILNADIALPDSSIEKIFQFLEEQQEKVGLAGPMLVDMEGNIQPSAFRFYNPLTLIARRSVLGKLPFGKKDIDRFLLKDVELSRSPTPVDWLMGSALFTTKKALERVGPFDERFFMYFEDVDWSRRFWEKGYQVVYYPEARLVDRLLKASRHSGGPLDLISNKYTRIHLVSAMKYFLKYGFRVPRFGK